jgi:pimeloyl-ACP methyl ester carboxylesterase
MTTTYVLVHGAWHGPWTWDRMVPLLRAVGARTLTPELAMGGDWGLRDHVASVVATIDTVPPDDHLVLVGHSYAGLVVREAADARPDAVDRVVLVDGWAGSDGAGMFTLAPDAFVQAVRGSAEEVGNAWLIPPPPPAAFGVVDPDDAAWLAPRLLAQPLRTFTDRTRLSDAVHRIPGTAIYCRPLTYPFDCFGETVGYHTIAVNGPHNVMLTDPELLARTLLQLPATPVGRT